MTDNLAAFTTVPLLSALSQPDTKITPSVTALLAGLADKGERKMFARSLAKQVGADDAIFFIKDAELGILLPAPGFLKTYPNHSRWNSFLEQCLEHSQYHGLLPIKGGLEGKAFGVAFKDECVLLLLGGNVIEQEITILLTLLPLICSVLVHERSFLQLSASLALAENSVMQTREIIHKLNDAQKELQFVLADKEKEIIERKQAEKAFQMSVQRFQLLLESVKDFAIFTLDLEGAITSWNEGAEHIYGYTHDEIIGKLGATLFSPQDYLQGIPQQEMQAVHSFGKTQYKRWHVRKNGSRFWAEGMLTKLNDGTGKLVGYTKVLKDDTDRKSMEEKVRHQALHDTLTGLPNRLLLEDRIQQAIAIAGRNQEKSAILFLDLDRFKLINDSFGHHAGDEVLKVAAKRLKESVRFEDTVARFGGDEFVVVLSGITSREEIETIIKKIITSFEAPIYLGRDPKEIYVNTSIGVALYPENGKDEQELIKNADAALYHAKESGRKGRSYFSDIKKRSSENFLRLEREMRLALVQNEFLVHYQPIVSLQTGELTGLEALLRWKHPTKGLILPNVFLSYAEDSGLIHRLGECVIESVCSDMAHWKKQGFHMVPVAINLSQARFYRPDFLENIKQSLIECDIDLNNLTVEVTENLASRHRDIAIEKLLELKELGIGISLDDFGTGNSSLTYLRDLPIDKVKIDKSFMVEGENHNFAIVKAICNLARNMGYSTVVEGIENKKQLEKLREFDYQGDLQGFYISKALDVPRIDEWLAVPSLAKKKILG